MVRFSLLTLLGVAFAGCAATTAVPPATLDAERSATNFAARSLQDAGLKKFLAENIGHEVTSPWDFETLSWVAFYYHPSLAVARAQWKTAQAVERTAGVRPNPTLTLTPGYNTTREAGVSPWLPAVNLDFLLATAGKRAHQQDIARHDAEAARLGVAIAAWTARSELRKALLETASALRREKSLRAQSAGQQRVLALLEQRFALGAIAAPEVSTARSALLRAESAAADAASQAAVGRAHVAAALGVPASALEDVALPVPAASAPMSAAALAEARRESLRSRADVLAALAKYQAAHAALELEVAKQAPDFHLGPGYQWDQGPNKWTLAISFELPVFHRNEAAIAEATARRTEAAAQFELVQTQVIGAIDAAVAAQTSAAAQLARARELQAEVARQAARTRQRLAAGGADQVEVQTAQLDVATAATSVLDAEVAAANATGALEDALQIPFPHLATLQ